ncbi:MAG: M20/M25/M40 family metallo-hydrolase [Acidobacteria bacterium]|nr:M20/M25/M40 family metallo-hydrolase [Acidobacteriota bacterium]
MKPQPLPYPILIVILIAVSTCTTTQVQPPLTFTLDTTEQAIVDAATARHDATIALLEEAVRIPSATSNHEGVRRVGTVFARELESLGFETRWIDLPPELDRAGHLIAERSGSEGKRLLLIGHLDTVIDGDWFERDGDIARASGGDDMKGGNVVMIEALRAMQSAGTLDGHQIIVFLTGDEEEGGRPLSVARAPLVEAAMRSDVALAFESSSPGSVTIGRRGVEQWRIEVEARTGHSSGIFRPGIGYGASYEAARILDTIRKSIDGMPNAALNPSVVLSGSQTSFDASAHHGSTGGVTNIVADKAIIEGDMRFLTPEQKQHLMSLVEEIVSTGNLPRTSARVFWNEGYPAMAPTEGNRFLAKVLDGVNRDLGLEPIVPGDPGRRGAGDVSFVADYVDAIDGLGSHGSHSHTIDETVRLDTLGILAARIGVLIHRLTDAGRLAQLGY